MPKCCVRRCGSRRDRLLKEAYASFEKSLYIHNLFKQMRVTEGLLRERFNLDKKAWKEAFKKYGPLKQADFDDSSVSEDVAFKSSYNG